MADASPIKDPNDAYRRGHDISGAATDAWQSIHDEGPTVVPWPELHSPAFHGIAGEIAHAATENSEADPVAILATVLTMAGAAFGRTRFYSVGHTDHHGRLFTALVGASSRARKGTSFEPVRKIFDEAFLMLASDPSLPFPANQPLKIVYGLSSGEGLINEVRDQRTAEDEDWAKDKRLLCVEGEFASVLKMAQRQGNTVSTVLRLAWDGWKLEPLTKNDKISATDAHICLLGHVTKHELKSMLTTNDAHNGFVNRFCWFAIRRQKCLPFPKPMSPETIAHLAGKIAAAVKVAHSRAGYDRELILSNAAMDHYANVYPELSADYPGLLGAATSRAEAQTLRIAAIYAQLDGADRIELQHLEAALSLWRYAFDSAAHLFGGAELDPAAQRIIEALTEGPKTQTAIVNLFGRNRNLNAILEDLQERGRITLVDDPSAKGRKGRPPRIWQLRKGWN